MNKEEMLEFINNGGTYMGSINGVIEYAFNEKMFNDFMQSVKKLLEKEQQKAAY